MANELYEYLEGLGLRDEAISKAIELATPETFRTQLAELGGENKALKAENQELRPLREAPRRAEALKPFGIDYEQSPKYLKAVFDQMDPEKLGDQEYVSQHLRENDVDVSGATAAPPAGERPKAAAIVDHAVNTGTGVAAQESYEAAVAAAQSKEDLDAVYARFGKEPAAT